MQSPAQAGKPCGNEIWFVDLDAAAALLEEIEAEHQVLSDAEIGHAASMTSGPRARDLWRWSHIALRVALERWAGPDVRGQRFMLGSRGKPALPGSGPEFSLAHSGGAALIGLSPRAAIGVDIELIRDLKMAPARITALEAAGAALSSTPLPADGGARRTLQAWVRFEAVAKAKGTGIGANLNGLRPGADTASTAEDEASLIVRDLAAPDDFTAAVATTTSSEIPAFLDFPAGNRELTARIFMASADGR